MAHRMVSEGMLAALGQVAADAGDDASRRLSMVIVALVVLAVVIAVATVVFWRITRPERVQERSGVPWAATDGQTIEPPAAAGPPISGGPAGRSAVDGWGPTASGGPPDAG